MHIYSNNDPAKFHPDPICNDADLGVFWIGDPKNNKTSSNMGAVPGPES